MGTGNTKRFHDFPLFTTLSYLSFLWSVNIDINLHKQKLYLYIKQNMCIDNLKHETKTLLSYNYQVWVLYE